MVMRQNPKRAGRTDISDLNEDPVVVWQHTHFLKCVITMALVVPAVVCGFGWGDWVGGFVYAGILRVCILQLFLFPRP
jgi:stearoyl-CoA desaturase (delta-9 desaturase)